MTKPSNLNWPFLPTCLNDILDQETLAVIESGSCERLGRPLTILDYDSKTGSFTHRIESVNEKQRYEEFCHYFRENNHVLGGDARCKKWDIDKANESLQDFRKTNQVYRVFPCHAGLMDMTHIIQIRGRPVALLFSGQYRPDDNEQIHNYLQGLVDEPNGNISTGQAEIEYLKDLTQKLLPIPTNARAQLEKEAMHIQRIAEAEFERGKRQNEHVFLESLRFITNVPGSMDIQQLRERIETSVRMIREYCGCQFVVFFAGPQESHTVLIPFAQAGIPEMIAGQLPHFNWSKARLPMENLVMDQDMFTSEVQKTILAGIRGNNRDFFSRVACLIPMAMGNRYRSALVFGPFKEAVDISTERHFLVEMARIISVFSRTGFEVLYLEQERRHWKNTASLLTHEVKTALTTIATPIGIARNILQSNAARDIDQVDEYLRQAEDQALLLGRITSGTLQGMVIQVEADDLNLESYSLSALVENCVVGFMELARSRNLELVLDASIFSLPSAQVDVPRLSIALANLIENAIKYSFSKSRIFIRSHLNISSGVDQATAVIEVDNIGFDISEDERLRIFEVGERGGSQARMRRIPGSGYGLWETHSIVQAHGGRTYVKITPTAIHKHEGRASRVVFSIEIPLKQKK
jgi:signal transduction histidine kinase/ligand-binding sensor protein